MAAQGNHVFCTNETRNFLNGFHKDLVDKIIPDVAKKDVAIFRPDDLRNLLTEQEQEALRNNDLTDQMKIDFAQRLLDLMPGENRIRGIEGQEQSGKYTIHQAQLEMANMFIGCLKGHGEPMNFPIARLNESLAEHGMVFESDVDNIIFALNDANQYDMSSFFMKATNLGETLDPKPEGEYSYLMDTVPAEVFYLHTLLHECAHSPQTHEDDSLYGRLVDEVKADFAAMKPLVAEFNAASGFDPTLQEMKFLEQMRALQSLNSHNSADHSTNSAIVIDEDSIKVRSTPTDVVAARENVLNAMYTTIRSLAEENPALREDMQRTQIEVDETQLQQKLFSDTTMGKMLASENPALRYAGVKSLLNAGFFEQGTVEYEIAQEYAQAVENLLPHEAQNEVAQNLIDKAQGMDDLFKNALLSGQDLQSTFVDGAQHPYQKAEETVKHTTVGL